METFYIEYILNDQEDQVFYTYQTAENLQQSIKNFYKENTSDAEITTARSESYNCISL
jgi:hypothetical protein